MQDSERVLCENIPADVCTQCEEQYFSAEVMEEIERFLQKRRQERPERYIPLPVYRPIFTPAYAYH